MLKTLTISYFAALREQAGVENESLSTNALTPQSLYAELQARHGFAHTLNELRVAIDESFASLDTPLYDGAHVVFIPPVSGG